MAGAVHKQLLNEAYQMFRRGSIFWLVQISGVVGPVQDAEGQHRQPIHACRRLASCLVTCVALPPVMLQHHQPHACGCVSQRTQDGGGGGGHDRLHAGRCAAPAVAMPCCAWCARCYRRHPDWEGVVVPIAGVLRHSVASQRPAELVLQCAGRSIVKFPSTVGHAVCRRPSWRPRRVRQHDQRRH